MTARSKNFQKRCWFLSILIAIFPKDFPCNLFLRLFQLEPRKSKKCTSMKNHSVGCSTKMRWQQKNSPKGYENLQKMLLSLRISWLKKYLSKLWRTIIIVYLATIWKRISFIFDIYFNTCFIWCSTWIILSRLFHMPRN